MAATLRARSLRHLRIRGRNDSGEENVSLDLSRGEGVEVLNGLSNVTVLPV